MQASAVQSAASLLGTQPIRGCCLSPHVASASLRSVSSLCALRALPASSAAPSPSSPSPFQARVAHLFLGSLSGGSSLRGVRVPTPRAIARTRAPAAASRVIVANWNQEVAWEEVEVAGVEKAAEQLYSIALNIKLNDKLQSGYTKAGQFVQVKVGDSKPAFLAIASPPQTAKVHTRMEFLVKAVEGTTAELLTKVQPGQFVQVSQVMGKGFNADALSPPDSWDAVILFATGSGISPIRALIESGFDASLRRDVRLYFGVRDLAHIPYQDKFKEWEESGVQVKLVLSQPAPAWTGEAGFVQDAFKRSTTEIEGPTTGAVLCGHKAMAEDVTKILKEKGVAPERILLNF